MKSPLKWLLPLCLILSGCGAQVVFVKPGIPVRLAQDVQASVYEFDGSRWVLAKGTATLPRGAYVTTATSQPSK